MSRDERDANDVVRPSEEWKTWKETSIGRDEDDTTYQVDSKRNDDGHERVRHYVGE